MKKQLIKVRDYFFGDHFNTEDAYKSHITKSDIKKTRDYLSGLNVKDKDKANNFDDALVKMGFTDMSELLKAYRSSRITAIVAMLFAFYCLFWLAYVVGGIATAEAGGMAIFMRVISIMAACVIMGCISLSHLFRLWQMREMHLGSAQDWYRAIKIEKGDPLIPKRLPLDTAEEIVSRTRRLLKKKRRG